MEDQKTFSKTQLMSEKQIKKSDINYFMTTIYGKKQTNQKQDTKSYPINDQTFIYYKKPSIEKQPLVALFYQVQLEDNTIEVARIELYSSTSLIFEANIERPISAKPITSQLIFDQKTYLKAPKITQKEAFAQMKQIVQKRIIFCFELNKNAAKILKICANLSEFENVKENFEQVNLSYIGNKLEILQKGMEITTGKIVEILFKLVELYGEEYNWWLFQLFEDGVHERNAVKLLQNAAADFVEF